MLATATGAVTGTIPIGNTPVGLALNPADTTLYARLREPDPDEHLDALLEHSMSSERDT